MVDPIWRIRLCDGLTLEDASGRTVHRFRSQKAAALLAYLALQRGRPCARERLCDLLWPEETAEVSRSRLRFALASLRRQLEPPGVPLGAVLESLGNNRVRLRPESVTTDLAEIEAALARGDMAVARQMAQGELLPTFFEDWVAEARQWFATLQERLQPGDDNSSTVSASDPPAPLPRFRQSLPVYLTRFFGRQKERARIAELLAAPDVRLVTLTGGGGHGKTRLAVETASAYQAGPVWFSALADLADGGQLPLVLLRTLGRTALPATDPMEQLAAFFTEWTSPLLVLDNLEQIAPRAAPIINSLLSVAPHLTILATSRSRLEVSGERTVLIPPLLPDGDDAAALFVDRAQSILPDFQQTPRNEAAIVAVCGLLDGVPLGIELAAARIGSLTVAKMQEQLENHWNALPAKRHISECSDSRHRSLRAAIEWSIALLPPDQKRLFIGFAAFSGGATLEAVEIVCDYPFALDTLTRLRAASLIDAHEEAGDLRFTVLEVLRQWAAESLPQEIIERHTRYYAERASTPFLNESALVSWMDREYANIRAALRHADQASDVSSVTRLLTVLGPYWLRHGHLREARSQFDLLLPIARTGPRDAFFFDTLAGAALIAQVVGELDEAETLWLEAQPVAEALGDSPRLARALATRGAVRDNLRDHEGAIAFNREALAIALASGDVRGQARSLFYLCGAHQNLAQWDAAEVTAQDGLAAALEIEDDLQIASFLYYLTAVAIAKKNLPLARTRLTEALIMFDRLNAQNRLHYALELFAELNAKEGALETAVVLSAAANRLRVSIGYPLLGVVADDRARERRALSAALGAAVYDELWQHGMQMSLTDAVALALRPVDHSFSAQ